MIECMFLSIGFLSWIFHDHPFRIIGYTVDVKPPLTAQIHLRLREHVSQYQATGLATKCAQNLWTDESCIHSEMDRNAGGIAQGNRPYPFQVGRESIDSPCLPHEGHARCR